MGALADAALDAGGKVIGVIPRGLVDRELAHPHLSELLVVGSPSRPASAAASPAFVA
jgi:predicted Rossmann-fold nucleotide-binding protein